MNDQMFLGAPLTHCRRCGRPLKSPESMQIGFGPVCLQKFRGEFQHATQMLLLPEKVEVVTVGPTPE